MRWTMHVARKRLLGMNRHIGEDNIKMYLLEIVLECADWIHPAYDKEHKCGEFLEKLSVLLVSQEGLCLMEYAN
jgi:NTP pyrophosphatase (non-canonical NTP hydrolase)